MIKAGKAGDYVKARELHDRLLPVTKSVYHRGSHMEGTVALKHALVARGIMNMPPFAHRCCRSKMALKKRSTTPCAPLSWAASVNLFCVCC